MHGFGRERNPISRPKPHFSFQRNFVSAKVPAVSQWTDVAFVQVARVRIRRDIASAGAEIDPQVVRRIRIEG